MRADAADYTKGCGLIRGEAKAPPPSYWRGALRGSTLCRRRLGLELCRRKKAFSRAVGRFWLRLASMAGDGYSMRALALSYRAEKGRGWLKKTVKWLSRAAKAGCAEAAADLGELLSREKSDLPASALALYLLCRSAEAQSPPDAADIYDLFISPDENADPP